MEASSKNEFKSCLTFFVLNDLICLDVRKFWNVFVFEVVCKTLLTALKVRRICIKTRNSSDDWWYEETLLENIIMIFVQVFLSRGNWVRGKTQSVGLKHQHTYNRNVHMILCSVYIVTEIEFWPNIIYSTSRR